MRLYSLLASAGLECPSGAYDIEVTEIVTDSRKITSGCMFICIRGQHFDGHDCIDNASEAGASVIVAELVRDGCVGGAAIVKVENTRRAAALLYNAWYGRPTDKLKLIGVTGTNGKTTVSFMIQKLLSAAGYGCGVIGTLGAYGKGLERIDSPDPTSLANMTTPDPGELFKYLGRIAEGGAEFAVMEVSSHALAMGRTEGIFFHTAVFTNLTRDHLDLHGTMEEYFNTKKRLFSNCERAVINIDDTYGRKIYENAPRGSFFSCSREGDGDFCAFGENIKDPDGAEFTLRYPGGEKKIKMMIPGGFAVINGLQAFAAAFGCIDDKAKASLLVGALSEFPGVCGRLERIENGVGLNIFVDYAHTPDALSGLLRTVRGFLEPAGRIILVFGCGGRRDTGKRREMGRIATSLADLTVITSDNSRDEDERVIFSQILRGVDKEKPHILIPSRKEAIGYAIRAARWGDAVILAGKGHERYEIDKWGKHPFDERQIVTEAIKKTDR